MAVKNSKKGNTRSRRKKALSRRATKGKGLIILAAIGIVLLGGIVGYWLSKKQGEQRPVSAPGVDIPEASVRIKLFFADDQVEFLIPEIREVMGKSPGVLLGSVVVRELIKGPIGDLQPTMPPGVELRSEVICEAGICTVDLSKEILSNHPGGTSAELMTIYSIVESLRENITGVRAVRFLVEGKTVETLAGHISLNEPVASNPAIIKVH